MTKKFNNGDNIPLAVAAWLAFDSYEYRSDPFTISATSLLKPTKEIVLGKLPDFKAITDDVRNLRASRTGTAVHDSIRQVWEDPEKRNAALKALGYNKRLRDMVRVNPETHDEDMINVYTEQRTTKKIGRWSITGEFDFWAEGRFEDFKNTGTYTFMKGTKNEDYINQLSIYWWLFQDIPSCGLGRIHMLMGDWKASQSFMEGYPSTDMQTIELRLKTPQQTEAMIEAKLAEIDAGLQEILGYDPMNPESFDQAGLTTCTPKEAWQKDTVFKYYAKPGAKRASKNFEADGSGAYAWLQQKGTGEVKAFPGSALYCERFCTARDRCQQGMANRKPK